MRRFLQIILATIVVGAIIYPFRQYFGAHSLPLWKDLKSQILTKYFPCKEPISYTLGTFATDFGLSQSDFLDALAQAEAVWEKPSGINLFEYVPNDTSASALKVNLVFDYREQATKNLAALGITVKNTRASYDSLRAKLTDLKGKYDKEKADFDKAAKSFDAKKKDYDEQVAYWNDKGGAPEEEYNKLQAMGADLQAESKELQDKEDDINGLVDEINALVVSINGIAKNLNLSVEKYNTINNSRGDSFEEGVFKSNGASREIDIYEFSNKQKLIRVLAHEFGHALGLDHVDDPNAIMYKLNEGTTATLDDTDIAALNELCGIKPATK